MIYVVCPNRHYFTAWCQDNNVVYSHVNAIKNKNRKIGKFVSRASTLDDFDPAIDELILFGEWWAKEAYTPKDVRSIQEAVAIVRLNQRRFHAERQAV
jgi:hypothetical protein